MSSQTRTNEALKVLAELSPEALESLTDRDGTIETDAPLEKIVRELLLSRLCAARDPVALARAVAAVTEVEGASPPPGLEPDDAGDGDLEMAVAEGDASQPSVATSIDDRARPRPITRGRSIRYFVGNVVDLCERFKGSLEGLLCLLEPHIVDEIYPTQMTILEVRATYNMVASAADGLEECEAWSLRASDTLVKIRNIVDELEIQDPAEIRDGIFASSDNAVIRDPARHHPVTQGRTIRRFIDNARDTFATFKEAIRGLMVLLEPHTELDSYPTTITTPQIRVAYNLVASAVDAIEECGVWSHHAFLGLDKLHGVVNELEIPQEEAA